MKRVKVILLKDVDGLGKSGELKEVPLGYYKNFLSPKLLAKKISEGEEKHYLITQKIKKSKEEKEQEEALKLKEMIEREEITIKKKAGEKGKLYGAVTNEEIAEYLKKKFKVKFDKKKIETEETIKTIGVHSVRIKLFRDIYANIRVRVIEEE